MIGGAVDCRVCPVCDSTSIREIAFHHHIDISKFNCQDCGHIFSSNLQRDLHAASELFSYNERNSQFSGQKWLSDLCANALVEPSEILDFGIGGNIGVLGELGSEYLNHQFWGCDLFPSDYPRYFCTYSEDTPYQHFDAIVSNAVIEHLDNTKEAWIYLNRLLKPVSKGGGIMMHAFPSQLIEDLRHWTINIASHECLFTKASLAHICRFSGFRLTKIRFHWQVQHPVYYFDKEFDR
jgi:hypothetical protein